MFAAQFCFSGPFVHASTRFSCVTSRRRVAVRSSSFVRFRYNKYNHGSISCSSAPLQTSVVPKENDAAPTPLTASDALLLVVFLGTSFLPALRTRPPPKHLLLPLSIFLLQSLLYLLRIRHLRLTFLATQRQHSDLESRIQSHIHASESRAITANRTLLATQFDSLAARIARDNDSLRARDGITRAALADLRTAVDAQARAADAERAANARAIDADARALSAERALRDAQLSHASALDDARNAGAAQAKELAGVRENALRDEIAALRRSMEDVPALRERLLAAQARVGALEERITMGAIVPVNNTQQGEPLAPARALRDALLTIGKTFPSAGRILFDPPVDQRPNTPPLQPLQQPTPLAWPDDALRAGEAGQEPVDVGLPDDGGFGLDHFESGAGATGAMDNARPIENTSPFSSFRGAFRNEGEERNLMEQGESEVAMEVAREGGKVGGEQSDVLSAEDVLESGPDVGSTEQAAVDYLKMEKEAQVAPSSEGKLEEMITAETVVEAAPRVDESTESVEDMLNAARELVKRGKRKEVELSEAVGSFEKAEEKLQQIITKDENNVQARGEHGLALLAWARRDLGGDTTAGRLQNACTLLRSCVEKDGGNESWLFNLGLSLCLLASLQETPECEALYSEACEHYDALLAMNHKSRIVFFNGGLAYISRARIAESAENRNVAIDMYTKAGERFKSALELATDDVKCKTYLVECQEQLLGYANDSTTESST